jgi:hypothetical protein
MNGCRPLWRALLVSGILLATTHPLPAIPIDLADPTPRPKAPARPKPTPKERKEAKPKEPKRSETKSLAAPSPISSKWLQLGVKSVWRHNGSTVGLIVNGSERSFVYISVSPEMRQHVSSGALLFQGSAEGSQFTGTAHRFRKGLPPVEYSVQGSVLNQGNTIELRGVAPTRDASGTVIKYVPEVMRFDLINAL